jgi:sarcosine oxidase subunit beta
VVVVGAGILGLSAAYYMAGEGLRVTVIEARDVASGTTGACDGNIMLLSKRPGPVLELAKVGTALYPSLIEELDEDVEYVRHGAMAICEDEDQLRVLKQMVETQRAAGLQVRLLSREDALEVQPGLADHVVGGGFLAEDGNVNQMALCFALARAARRKGASVRLGVPVVSLLSNRGLIRGVRTAEGDVPAPMVLIAAGVWSPDIARTVGLELPIKPRKGQILIGEKSPPLLHTTLISPSYISHKLETGAGSTTPISASESVSLGMDQTRSGTFLIGSSREFAGFDVTTSPEVVRTIARTALRVFPPLRGRRVIRSFAGLRPYVPDGLPIMGEVPSCRGLYVAAGHEGDGIALGPISGKLMAELAAHGACSVDLTDFSPGRFVNSHATTAGG